MVCSLPEEPLLDAADKLENRAAKRAPAPMAVAVPLPDRNHRPRIHWLRVMRDNHLGQTEQEPRGEAFEAHSMRRAHDPIVDGPHRERQRHSGRL